jgi:hypothetical protein
MQQVPSNVGYITDTQVCSLLDLDLDPDVDFHFYLDLDLVPDVDLHLDLDLDLQTCIRDADMQARDIRKRRTYGYTRCERRQACHAPHRRCMM